MEEWWKGCVIYQIYPRSFQDTSGNGIGDLKGIIQRLDYISKLGVDAIWLSPIFESPMNDMGYDISNYQEIDPLFGDLDDFDLLLEKAHSLGLKVIIDQVLSHSSDQHPFFLESRSDRNNEKSDWYVWADPKKDGSPPNNWLSIFGGVGWEWETSRKQYYLHNFLKSQPDLNFNNPNVRKWVLSIVEFWLKRGVDGFRLDTVNYYYHDSSLRDNPVSERREEILVNPYYMQEHKYSINRPENLEFIKKLRALVDKYKDKMMVGEISNIDLQAKYTSGDDKLHMAYSFELLRKDFSATHIKNCLERFYELAPNGYPCWSFSNHDVMRHISRWSDLAYSPEDFAKLTASILLSLKGSICIYQGEELGQLETDLEFHELTDPPGIKFWPKDKGRDGCRTPMVWEGNTLLGGFSKSKPWLPIKEEQLERSVDSQIHDKESVLTHYCRLIEFRKNNKEFLEGELIFKFFDDKSLVFTRKFDDEETDCYFNFSKDDLEFNDINSSINLTSIKNKAKLKDKKLFLGPNGFAFLKVLT